MKHWKPIDIIVAILAISVVSVLVVAVYDSKINNDQLTDAGTKRITAIMTSVLSIVSMYVGAKIQERKDSNND